MRQRFTALQQLQPLALACFAEMARTRSLRMAARTFDLAPSSLSRQLATLEGELGVTLFQRSAQGMAVTPAGQVLLRFLEETENRVAQLKSDIDDLSSLARGSVRLSVVEAVASDLLPSVLAEFHDRAPGIEFRIRVCGTHEIADQIAGDESDIGIAFNVLDRDDLVLHGRMYQPLRLVCRPDHPLAARKSVALELLDGARVALPVRSFGIRYLIDNAARQARVRLVLAYESDSLQAIRSLVRSSADVVTFLPPLSYEYETQQGSLCSVRLTNRSMERASVDVVTARHRTLSAAAQAFLALMLKRMRAQAPAG